jgi:hypothetical protein
MDWCSVVYLRSSFEKAMQILRIKQTAKTKRKRLLRWMSVVRFKEKGQVRDQPPRPSHDLNWDVIMRGKWDLRSWHCYLPWWIGLKEVRD